MEEHQRTLLAAQGYVNLYAGGSADIETPGGKLKVVQDTRYPWDGAVKMTMTPNRARRFALNLRIPGWARNEAVPGDLERIVPGITLGPRPEAVPVRARVPRHHRHGVELG